jgi:hypothetical protein
MLGRQLRQPDPASEEEGAGADEQGVEPLPRKVCEGGVDLAAGAGVKQLNVQTHHAGGGFNLSCRGISNGGVGWIDERGNAGDPG